ncbi:MAG: NotI family restriction endonuclease [bacterium]|nr:NotI family restriction endonuclease [bacterium]
MAQQPMAEVFGFPAENMSERAQRHRKNRLCPFNNKVPNCTKDKANDPLGVCSVFDSTDEPVITCPIRFRQDWLIAEDAASFFFSSGEAWTSLTEIRLNDSDGLSAGNIDLVLVSYDERGRIMNFGSLEIQAVYISGNIRDHFSTYMDAPSAYLAGDRSRRMPPRPDYLSSSRKRLLPQLLYKGSILKHWGKRQAVALHRKFFETLPRFDEVDKATADMAWLIYDLERVESEYQLRLVKTVYTQFEPALARIATPRIGQLDHFVSHLQRKLDEKLENGSNTPDAPTLSDGELS